MASRQSRRRRSRFLPDSSCIPLESRALLTLAVPTINLTLKNILNGLPTQFSPPPSNYSAPISDAGPIGYPVQGNDTPLPPGSQSMTQNQAYSNPDGHGGIVSVSASITTTAYPNLANQTLVDLDTTMTSVDSGTEPNGTRYTMTQSYTSHNYYRNLRDPYTGTGDVNSGTAASTLTTFDERQGSTALHEQVISQSKNDYKTSYFPSTSQLYTYNASASLTYDTQTMTQQDAATSPGVSTSDARSTTYAGLTYNKSGSGSSHPYGAPQIFITGTNYEYDLTTLQDSSARTLTESNNLVGPPGFQFAAEDDGFNDEGYNVYASAGAGSVPVDQNSTSNERDTAGDGSDYYQVDEANRGDHTDQNHGDGYSYFQKDANQDANNYEGTNPNNDEQLNLYENGQGTSSNALSQVAVGGNSGMAGASDTYNLYGQLAMISSVRPGTASLVSHVTDSLTDSGQSYHDLVLTTGSDSESDHAKDQFQDNLAQATSIAYQAGPAGSTTNVSTSNSDASSDGGSDALAASLGDGTNSLASSNSNQYAYTDQGASAGQVATTSPYYGQGYYGFPSADAKAPVQVATPSYNGSTQTIDSLGLTLASGPDFLHLAAKDAGQLTASGVAGNFMGGGGGVSTNPALTLSQQLTGSSSLSIALPDQPGQYSASASDTYADSLSGQYGSAGNNVTRNFNGNPLASSQGSPPGMFMLPAPTAPTTNPPGLMNPEAIRAAGLLGEAQNLDVETLLGQDMAQATSGEGPPGGFYGYTQAATSNGTMPAPLPSGFASLPNFPAPLSTIAAVSFATPAAAIMGQPAVTVGFSDGTNATVTAFGPFGTSTYDEEPLVQLGAEDTVSDPKVTSFLPFEYQVHPRRTITLFPPMQGNPTYRPLIQTP